jgi:hypothetical protein
MIPESDEKSVTACCVGHKRIVRFTDMFVVLEYSLRILSKTDQSLREQPQSYSKLEQGCYVIIPSSAAHQLVMVRQNMLIGLSMLTHVILQAVLSPGPVSIQPKDVDLGK